MRTGTWLSSAAVAVLCLATPAYAQRADENVVRSAGDAFGVQLGNDRIGLYSQFDTRGFSPVTAANVRLEGMYYDMRSNIPSRLISGSTIRVGLTAQNYPFPAPTGIADFNLRNFGDEQSLGFFGSVGPNDAFSLEAEIRAPIDGARFGFAAGVFARHEEAIPWDGTDVWGMGFIPRWRPRPGTEVTAFFGYGERFNDRSTPVVFTSGAFLPPEVEARAFSEEWTETDNYIESYGVIGRHRLGQHWRVDAGIFRFNNGGDGNTSEIFSGVNQAGLASTHRFIDDPGGETRNLSGETRFTGVYSGEDLRHTFTVALRGREQRRIFGGSSVRTFGPAQIGQISGTPEPTWTYGQQSRDDVTQISGALGYDIALRNVGQLSFGVQRVQYDKTFTTPSSTDTTTDSPLLYNASAAFTAIPRVVLYASYTRGLEEAPTAPDIATNAFEAPPAILTSQYDFGARFAITPRLSLVAGYFNVEKPYYNLDPSNLYRNLGIERHAGAEISLAGAVTDRLNIVAGAVIMNPVVEGEAVTSGLIGSTPVGQAEVTFRINADYRTPWIEGLSIDGAIAYSSERAASSRRFVELGGRQLFTDAFLTLDLGARYRFRIDDHPATLRVQATNVLDEFAWQTFASGALYVSNPRGFVMSLSADF